jgi:hypothetical protein
MWGLGNEMEGSGDNPVIWRTVNEIARLEATDAEGDPLAVRWEIRSESADRRQGGDRETGPPAHPECVVAASGLEATFRAPDRRGGYRVFAFVSDGKGGAACANIPFAVRAQ